MKEKNGRREKSFQFSNHATRRMSQRAISEDAISATIEFGGEMHRAGVTYYILRRKDAEKAKRKNRDIHKYTGTIVLVSGGEIVTAFRNKDISWIRRLSKRDKSTRRSRLGKKVRR